jgi:hypothetical protein
LREGEDVRPALGEAWLLLDHLAGDPMHIGRYSPRRVTSPVP